MRRETINLQLIFTLCLLIQFTLFFEWTNADVFVQNLLFNPQTNQWLLNKHNKITHFMFYNGIKYMYAALYLITLISIIFFKKSVFIKTRKKGIFIFFTSFILVPIIIVTLKKITHIPCPSHLTLFGGEYHYTKLFASHLLTKGSACYPAGHASSGFALMSLFFVFKKPLNKTIALGFAITLGWVTGIYKMAIGDHFLSHTITSMLMAWLIILLIVKLFACYKRYCNLKKKKQCF